MGGTNCGDNDAMAYAIYCPAGHAEDHVIVYTLRTAEAIADQFATQTGEDGWMIYPLVRGAPILR